MSRSSPGCFSSRTGHNPGLPVSRSAVMSMYHRDTFEEMINDELASKQLLQEALQATEEKQVLWRAAFLSSVTLNVVLLISLQCILISKYYNL